MIERFRAIIITATTITIIIPASANIRASKRQSYH